MENGLISFANPNNEDMGGIIEVNVVVPQVFRQFVNSSNPFSWIAWRVAIFLLQSISEILY